MRTPSTCTAAILLALVAVSAFAAEEKTQKEKAFDSAVSAYKRGYAASKNKSLDAVGKQIVAIKKDLDAAKKDGLTDRAGNFQKALDALQARKADLQAGTAVVDFDFVPDAKGLFSFPKTNWPSPDMSGLDGICVTCKGTVETRKNVSSATPLGKGKGGPALVAPRTVIQKEEAFRSFRFALPESGLVLGLRSKFLWVTDKMVDHDSNPKTEKIPLAYLFEPAAVHAAAFPPKEVPAAE